MKLVIETITGRLFGGLEREHDPARKMADIC